MTTDAEPTTGTREAFLAALEAGNVHQAIVAARSLLGQQPRIHQCGVVRKAVDRMHPRLTSLVSLRVALLSSFSIEFLHDSLGALAFLDGLHLDIYQAGFGQFRQEILESRSRLYTGSPDVVVLAVEGRDLVPAVYRQALPEGPAGGMEKAVAEARDELAALIGTFRERSSATLLIHNFAPPVWRHAGILDGHAGPGQADLVHELNAALRAVCREVSGVYVVDYAGLVGRVGAAQWYDLRMEHYAKAPISQRWLPCLAREYLKFFRGLTGKTKKCLVLDLDNTLWGGVIGEDGLHGIALGPTYPGSAFVAFQEAVLGLHQRGVILALASKNNPADVDEVFDGHAHMRLRREHFSDMQIHWGAKSDSLVQIARRLNIGLEHVVFVDDNPAECEQVVSVLPMVTVIRLPGQPERFVETLLEPGLFDGLSVSAEDRRRGELYKQRDEAEDLRRQTGSLEEFYEKLAMEVVLAPVGPATLARAAQLTQKTNQFTTTTVRYSEAEMAARCTDDNWVVRTVSVRDRFGDNGIVGVMMARADSDTLEVEALLLSCRVIGRTVETAMLAHLCEHARRRGLTRLRGRIVLTSKNEPVRALYRDHGFEKVEVVASGELTWMLSLDRAAVNYPRWLTIVDETSA